MPLRAHHLPPRSTAPDRPTRAVADLPFDDLVYLLAAGVADAQTALDARTAATLATFAETEIDVVPSLTRTVASDGTVTTDAAPAEPRSLLELGLTPARYRFSDATIEVAVDVSAADRDRSGRDRPEGERAEPAFDLRAGTQSVIDRRTFDREAGANARLAARLEPTPPPVAIGPEETSDVGNAGNAGDAGETRNTGDAGETRNTGDAGVADTAGNAGTGGERAD
ncbi:hypothetical protein [Halorubrum kocurii]|uniref:Uncharacterized protein n=1 Tax=Halorubrum kocurii JCM 14978 TaxID=1230456 RepID=M0P444_9EURY|nr:hypothetical protein [Halorubrum kocurii]EMA64558.1 hypothetical protein C468_08474 [Halorubrum kocurii JCM 14978]